MQLVPYIFFHGRCEEALEFYKAALGGELNIMRIEGSPMEAQSPPEWKNKVMHARLTFEGGELLASDGRPGTMNDNNEISLSISLNDEAEADRIFAALSAGGKVEMPMQDTFWGAKFGTFTDKFGIDWMINCEKPS
jgi:PhnB protein